MGRRIDGDANRTPKKRVIEDQKDIVRVHWNTLSEYLTHLNPRNHAERRSFIGATTSANM